jgi:hypothetical protein
MSTDRSALTAVIRSAADGRELARAVAALDAHDRRRAAEAAADRELDLAATRHVASVMTPVALHERHTAATDWLADAEIPADYRAAMIAEASAWYTGLDPAVRADAGELGEQALGRSASLASQYGEVSAAAQREFLSVVAYLNSREGGSGLPQIDQTIDANNQPAPTPYPTEVFDNFAPEQNEYNTQVESDSGDSQISSQQAPMIQQIQQQDSSGSGYGSGPEREDLHTTRFDTSNSYAEVPLGPPGQISTTPAATDQGGVASTPNPQAGQLADAGADRRPTVKQGARGLAGGGGVTGKEREDAPHHLPGTDKFPIGSAADVENAKHDIGRTDEPKSKVVHYIDEMADEYGVAPVGGKKTASVSSAAYTRPDGQGFRWVVASAGGDDIDAPWHEKCAVQHWPDQPCGQPGQEHTASVALSFTGSLGDYTALLAGERTGVQEGQAILARVTSARQLAEHHNRFLQAWASSPRMAPDTAVLRGYMATVRPVLAEGLKECSGCGKPTAMSGKCHNCQLEGNKDAQRAKLGRRLDFNWAAQASLQKGAPFAGYEDFDSCVAANQGKHDPEAYCGKIKHQVEGSLQKEGVWQRRHYDELAEMISAHPKREELARAFSRSLYGSNPYYDAGRFENAASSENYRGTRQAHPNFSRQHYQHAAHVIHGMGLSPDDMRDVATHFAEGFGRLNSKFKQDRFFRHVLMGGNTAHPEPRPRSRGGVPPGYEPVRVNRSYNRAEDVSPDSAHYHARPPGEKIDPVFGAQHQGASTLPQVQQTVDPNNAPTPQADQLPADVMFPLNDAYLQEWETGPGGAQPKSGKQASMDDETNSDPSTERCTDCGHQRGCDCPHHCTFPGDKEASRRRKPAGEGQFVSAEKQKCTQCGNNSKTAFSDGSSRCVMCGHEKKASRHQANGYPMGDMRPAETMPDGTKVGDHDHDWWGGGEEMEAEEPAEVGHQAGLYRSQKKCRRCGNVKNNKGECMGCGKNPNSCSCSSMQQTASASCPHCSHGAHEGQCKDGDCTCTYAGRHLIHGMRRRADTLSQPHQTTDDIYPPYNSPQTTPAPIGNGDYQAGFRDGQADRTSGERPTFSDNSSGVSPYVSGYAAGYSGQQPGQEPPQNPDIPRSLGGDSGQAQNAGEAASKFLVSKGSRMTKNAGTSVDLVSDGPGTSPDPMGSTPINGPGTPPQMGGLAEAAQPGGPSPYQGAPPFGQGPVVPDPQAGQPQRPATPEPRVQQSYSGGGDGVSNGTGINLAPQAPNAAGPGYSNPGAYQGSPGGGDRTARFRATVQANLTRMGRAS